MRGTTPQLASSPVTRGHGEALDAHGVKHRLPRSDGSPDWGLYGFILGYVALVCGGALLLS